VRESESSSEVERVQANRSTNGNERAQKSFGEREQVLQSVNEFYRGRVLSRLHVAIQL